MFTRFLKFWQGQIYFSVSGGDPALFLNTALKEGIALYHTQKAEHGLRAIVSLQDFPRLRQAVRLSHVKVRIRAKYGWPFIARRWWRRKGLILGVAVVGMSLSILSQLVLFITVSGNHMIDSSELLLKANTLGLKTWVWNRGLDLNAIANGIQNDFPDAAWVGVSRKGTHVAITVVEKKRIQAHTEAGNLVAAKTGLVKEIMVIQGVPQVHEGQMVKAGQVLITQPALSQVSPPAGNSKSGATSSPVAAKGFVRGRVWYSAEASVPLQEDRVIETGAQSKGYGIKFGSRVIMVTTPASPYPLFHQEVGSTPIFMWRNWRIPVEVITVTYTELEKVHLDRTPVEARQAAEEEARADIRKKLTFGITPVEESVKVLASKAGVERVRIEVETYEDLAVYPKP